MTLYYDWEMRTGTVYRDGAEVGEVRQTRRHGGDWYIAVVDGRDGDGWTQIDAIMAACPGENVMPWSGREKRSNVIR